MRNFVIILLFLFANLTPRFVNAQCYNNNRVYWEQINDNIKKETIASSTVNINVVNYYEGNLKFTDNEKSFDLLDTLVSEPVNENIKALYLYVFNDICAKSDGAIAEILGKYCQKIILNDPFYVLNYLSSYNTIMKRYAQLLGYEFYFKEEGVSDMEYNFNEFKKKIYNEIDNDIDLKHTFDNFNSEIERTMKNMD